MLAAAPSAPRRWGVSNRGASRALWSPPFPVSSAAAAAAGAGRSAAAAAAAAGLFRPGPALPAAFAAAMELEVPEEAEGSAVAGAGAMSPEAGVGGLDAAGGNGLRAPGRRYLGRAFQRASPRDRSRWGPPRGPEWFSPATHPPQGGV